MKILIFVLFVILFKVDGKAKWPVSIPRCSRHDPNFVSCVREAALKSLPILAKGIPSLNLPKLDPLENINFTLNNDRWPVSLKVDMTNAAISGPASMQIRDIRFDPTTQILNVDGFHKKLTMYGQYKVRGNVLVFPLNSQGTFNFILRDVLAHHSLKLSNKTRDADHGNIGFTVRSLGLITMELNDPHFNKPANRALNKLVNDNWKIISAALTPSMERVIQKTFKMAFKPLFSKFSMDEVFPSGRITPYSYDAAGAGSALGPSQYYVHVLQPTVPIQPLFLIRNK